MIDCEPSKTSIQKVAVIYHFFPHYRAPVIRALAGSKKYKFEFWGAHDSVEGIPSYNGDPNVIINQLQIRWKFGSYFRISGYWKPVLSSEVRALIVIGNPNILDTWFIALAGRFFGKAVFFWTHGWLKREPYFKALFRNLYFSISHRVLVYGDRALILAANSGFSPDKVTAIYNSLDWERSVQLYDEMTRISRDVSFGKLKKSRNHRQLVCTARLTSLCRFDLLLEAMAILNARSHSVCLTLIGDGPERSSLEAQAKRLGVQVKFLGAIYDEAVLARLIYSAELTVCPGKIGLAAMHSLSYGTPVITHDDFDSQMPEVEAIIAGETGDFFARGDVEALANAIQNWLAADRDRDLLRAACRKIIGDRYTPKVQSTLIEGALDEVIGKNHDE